MKRCPRNKFLYNILKDKDCIIMIDSNNYTKHERFELDSDTTSEVYKGKRTLQAIRSRLFKEKCMGRWAEAIYLYHDDICTAGVLIDFNDNVLPRFRHFRANK